MTNPQDGPRCGIGYDSHRLVEGRPLIIGGVDIPSQLGLLGHSDGDVLCHAIADALLGAAALGDIGKYFPDTDPRWQGAKSILFLRTIAQLLVDSSYCIINIDSVVVLDEPKLAPYIPKFRQRLAETLSLEITQISVKAKRTEGAYAIPMAASHVVALIEKQHITTI